MAITADDVSLENIMPISLDFEVVEGEHHFHIISHFSPHTHRNKCPHNFIIIVCTKDQNVAVVLLVSSLASSAAPVFSFFTRAACGCG